MGKIDHEPSSSLELKMLRCLQELVVWAQSAKSELVPYKINNLVSELSKAKKESGVPKQIIL